MLSREHPAEGDSVCRTVVCFIPLIGINLTDGTLPVSLAQIGQDLDAQLLEFTLMAKAREHTADEVDKAEQVQEETTRKTDKVRQPADLPRLSQHPQTVTNE